MGIYQSQRGDSGCRLAVMNISTENQLVGYITAIIQGAVCADVEVAVSGGHSIFSHVTKQALEELELTLGNPVIALVKASAVHLSINNKPRISVQNKLSGQIVCLNKGPINSYIQLALPSQQRISVSITSDALDELNLAVGVECTALFKAAHVILARP